MAGREGWLGGSGGWEGGWLKGSGGWEGGVERRNVWGGIVKGSVPEKKWWMGGKGG